MLPQADNLCSPTKDLRNKEALLIVTSQIRKTKGHCPKLQHPGEEIIWGEMEENGCGLHFVNFPGTETCGFVLTRKHGFAFSP